MIRILVSIILVSHIFYLASWVSIFVFFTPTESSLSDLTLHSLPPTTDNQRSKCSPNTSERGSVKSIPGARGSPDSYNSLPKKSNSTSQLSATGKYFYIFGFFNDYNNLIIYKNTLWSLWIPSIEVKECNMIFLKLCNIFQSSYLDLRRNGWRYNALGSMNLIFEPKNPILSEKMDLILLSVCWIYVGANENGSNMKIELKII